MLRFPSQHHLLEPVFRRALRQVAHRPPRASSGMDASDAPDARTTSSVALNPPDPSDQLCRVPPCVPHSVSGTRGHGGPRALVCPCHTDLDEPPTRRDAARADDRECHRRHQIYDAHGDVSSRQTSRLQASLRRRSTRRGTRTRTGSCRSQRTGARSRIPHGPKGARPRI
jgi:hypothetical protein